MNIKEIDALLREHPFFEGMTEDHIAILSGCASNVNFKKEEVIFRQDEKADIFYIIKEGRVTVDIVTTSEVVRVQTLEKNDVLGWSWFFPPHVWHFDAMAVEPVRAFAMDAKCLREKCEKDPALGYDLLKRFSSIVVNRLEATRLQTIDMFGTSARS